MTRSAQRCIARSIAASRKQTLVSSSTPTKSWQSSNASREGPLHAGRSPGLFLDELRAVMVKIRSKADDARRAYASEGLTGARMYGHFRPRTGNARDDDGRRRAAKPKNIITFVRDGGG